MTLAHTRWLTGTVSILLAYSSVAFAQNSRTHQKIVAPQAPAAQSGMQIEVNTDPNKPSSVIAGNPPASLDPTPQAPEIWGPDMRGIDIQVTTVPWGPTPSWPNGTPQNAPPDRPFSTLWDSSARGTQPIIRPMTPDEWSIFQSIPKNLSVDEQMLWQKAEEYLHQQPDQLDKYNLLTGMIGDGLGGLDALGGPQPPDALGIVEHNSNLPFVQQLLDDLEAKSGSAPARTPPDSNSGMSIETQLIDNPVIQSEPLDPSGGSISIYTELERDPQSEQDPPMTVEPHSYTSVPAEGQQQGSSPSGGGLQNFLNGASQLLMGLQGAGLLPNGQQTKGKGSTTSQSLTDKRYAAWKAAQKACIAQHPQTPINSIGDGMDKLFALDQCLANVNRAFGYQ